MKRKMQNAILLGTLAGMFSLTSCKDNANDKTEASEPIQNEMHNGEIDEDAHVEDQMLNMSDDKKVRAEFSNEKAAQAYEDYIGIVEAMVESDPESAKEAAQELEKVYEEGSENANVSKLASRLAASNDINKQREIFSELSAAIEPVLKNNLESGKIFKQYCPMAFEGKGDYWYSDRKAIRNPFFGEKMLNCGRTEETIQ